MPTETVDGEYHHQPEYWEKIEHMHVEQTAQTQKEEGVVCPSCRLTVLISLEQTEYRGDKCWLEEGTRQ